MTEWEPVQSTEFSSTDRLAVPGGWLYRVQHHSQRLSAQSVVFVPTPRSVSWKVSDDELVAPTVTAERGG